MRVSVWDTHVTKKDGTVMNFDVIVPESETDDEIIFENARQYLATKGMTGYPISTHHCKFCHVEWATPEMQHGIREKGYYIVELRNCQ